MEVWKEVKGVQKVYKIHLFLPNPSYDTYNHLMTIILPHDKLCIHLSTESAKVNVYQGFQRSYLDHKNHMISRFENGSLFRGGHYIIWRMVWNYYK